MAILAKVSKVFYAHDELKHSARVAEVGYAIAKTDYWDSTLKATHAKDIVAAGVALRAEVRGYLEVRNMPIDSFAFEIVYADISDNGLFWPHFDLSNGRRYLVSSAQC